MIAPFFMGYEFAYLVEFIIVNHAARDMGQGA